MNKQELRKQMRALNLAVDPLDRRLADLAFMRHQELREALKSAAVVAVFSPLPDEPALGDFVHKELLARGYRVVLPRVEGDTMNFYDYRKGKTVVVEPYGIEEPDPDAPLCRAEEIDVMIVPGVAFTRFGDRLGRGKGYYDKYMSLPGFRAKTFGYCYPHQMFLELPTDPHDVRVDGVVVGHKSGLKRVGRPEA